MKNTVKFLLASLALGFLFFGCKKSELAAPAKSLTPQSLKLASGLKLTVSQSVTTKNKADTLTISGLGKKDSVKWSITPPGYTNIIQQNANGMIVSFEIADTTFKIKAIVNGKDTLTASIKVDSTKTDTTGSGSPQSLIPFKAGDQLMITPSIYKGATADSVGIMFSAHTADAYNCLNSGIYASWSDKGNSFAVNYMDVVQPNAGWCLVGSRVLSLNSFFPQNPADPYLVNGTYPLTVVFGTTTYKGNIIVTNNAIKFDWSYTSGVTFTAKQISR
jgi:hypothetical protein